MRGGRHNAMQHERREGKLTKRTEKRQRGGEKDDGTVENKLRKIRTSKRKKGESREREMEREGKERYCV